jgi:hypothetical protein
VVDVVGIDKEIDQRRKDDRGKRCDPDRAPEAGDPPCGIRWFDIGRIDNRHLVTLVSADNRSVQPQPFSQFRVFLLETRFSEKCEHIFLVHLDARLVERIDPIHVAG